MDGLSVLAFAILLLGLVRVMTPDHEPERR